MNRGKLHPLAIRQLPPYGGAARQCARANCITLLNGYNPGPLCLIHTPEQGAMERSRELDQAARREARERAKVSPGSGL